MSQAQYTTNVGDYIVIWLTYYIGGTYIAEVIQSNPLRLKLEETGIFSRLKEEEFTILESDTELFQTACREGTNGYLEAMQRTGEPPLSGLRSLGVTDNTLREILPKPKGFCKQIC